MNTILVVDDDERIRRIYETFLTRRGYMVLTAKDAVTAREILKHKMIDLMLLDINMGEVGGEILHEITTMFHKDVNIIVSSVFPLDDQEKIIPGAVDYYDKSQGLRVLLEKVNNVAGQ